MSTRSEVKIIGEYQTIRLYHHHDGYPEGVGFDLMNRFYDKMQDWRNFEFDSVVNQLVKDANDEYEVTQYNHTDREYEYEINIPNKTIKCFECDWYDDENGDWNCKKGKEIDLLPLWRKEENKVEA